MLWADSDPILPPHVGERFAEAIGGPRRAPIADASHFLQEDQGPLIGSLIADWLTGRLAPTGPVAPGCAGAYAPSPPAAGRRRSWGSEPARSPASRPGSERAARSS